MTTDHRVQLRLSGQLGEVVSKFVQGWGFGGPLRTTATTTSGDFSGFTEHADHLSPNLRKVDTQIFQYASSHAFAFANQAKKEMLGADVVMTELTSFF